MHTARKSWRSRHPSNWWNPWPWTQQTKKRCGKKSRSLRNREVLSSLEKAALWVWISTNSCILVFFRMLYFTLSFQDISCHMFEVPAFLLSDTAVINKGCSIKYGEVGVHLYLYFASFSSLTWGSNVLWNPNKVLPIASLAPIIGRRTAIGTARTTARTVP